MISSPDEPHRPLSLLTTSSRAFCGEGLPRAFGFSIASCQPCNICRPMSFVAASPGSDGDGGHNGPEETDLDGLDIFRLRYRPPGTGYSICSRSGV